MSETLRPDPCDDPKPPMPPKPPVEPCPEPPQTTCPEPRPCPEPPPKPCPPKPPDPCDDAPEGDSPTQQGTPGKPAEPPPRGGEPDKPAGQTSGNPYQQGSPHTGEPPRNQEPPRTGEPPKNQEPPKPGESPKPGETPKPPAPSPCSDGGGVHTQQQLKDAEAELLAEKAKIEDLDRSKAKAAALEAKVQALKETIKAQKKSNDEYRNFYNDTQLLARGAASHIATVRCQLNIDKKCVAAVIAAGRKRVDDARAARDAALGKVTGLEQAYSRAAFELAEYKKLYEFFKAGLKEQVKKVTGDLSALQALADPKKDHCETEFYLTEMEWHLRSLHCKPETSTECYSPDLRLGTYIECWAPECYCLANDRATAAYNDAVVAEKMAKADLDSARAKLKDAEDALKTLDKNRRDWVLAELKARGCCKPKDKPAAAV